jgi:hypothetical protein
MGRESVGEDRMEEDRRGKEEGRKKDYRLH